MSEEIDAHVLELYRPVRKIGSGAYGHVWKVVDKKTGTVKALKKNFDAFTNATDAQRTYREVAFLRQLKHQNIVILEQIVKARNDRDIYLVFEHMDIDLHTLIRENSQQQHLQEKHKKFILFQIAKAIHFLHNSQIIHRDLKPSNVLINENCEAKLCDFGLVRSLEEVEIDQRIMTDYIATRWYRAPELLLGCTSYSKEVDVWALGCLFGELFRGKAMFNGSSTLNQIEKVLCWTGCPTSSEINQMPCQINKGMMDLLCTRRKVSHCDFFPEKLSADALDLLQKMLLFDPKKRISIGEIIEHPYLSDFFKDSQLNEIRAVKAHIRLQIRDNTKSSVKDYRDAIYQQIAGKPKVLGISNRPRSKICGQSPAQKLGRDENIQSKISREKSLQKHKTLAGETTNQFAPNFERSKPIMKKSQACLKGKGSSLRRKGISVCSKQANSLSKKKYSEPSGEEQNWNGKRQKSLNQSYHDRTEKGKNTCVVQKRKMLLSHCLVNENIGKHERRRVE